MDDKGLDEQQSPPPPPPTPPGKQLCEKREALGLSQTEVAESLHLTVHYINALERDEYKKLPGRTFVKGYFKSYAKLLKMDVDALMEDFEAYTAAREESREQEQRQTHRRAGDQNLRWLLAAALMILVVVAVAWWIGRDGAAGTGTVRTPTATREAPPAQPVRAGNRPTAESLIEGAAARSPAAIAADAGPAGEASPVESPAAGGPLTNGPAASSPVPEGSATQASGEAGALEATDGETEELSTAAADNAESSPAGGTAAPVPGQEADNGGEAGADDAAPAAPLENQQEGRIISLNSAGDDQLVMEFTGTSWVEVDNRDSVRLYNDNLHAGDRLSIRGEAPFSVLIGNAAAVSVSINSRPVDLEPVIRDDQSARVLLEP